MLLSNVLPLSLHIVLSSFLVQESLAQSMRFRLRHAHGLAANSSRVVFSDIHSSAHFTGEDVFEIPTKRTKVHRARSQSDFFAARTSGRLQNDLVWDETDVIGPDIRSQDTLRLLANITNNAYYEDRSKTGWYDLGPEWNTVRYTGLHCCPKHGLIRMLWLGRVIHLDGNLTPTASAVTSSLMKIIRL